MASADEITRCVFCGDVRPEVGTVARFLYVVRWRPSKGEVGLDGWTNVESFARGGIYNNNRGAKGTEVI